MHIGKSVGMCSELKVLSEAMKKSDIEMYIGDIVSTSGNIKENISKRVCISEINNILKEIPLGQCRIDIGLQL